MSQVIFSFFRYPLQHAPRALLVMGFQGWINGRDRPDGLVRLMGCGSGDGFSIVPDLRAYCLMRVLDDPGAEARLRRTRLYRAIADPSSEQIHFTLRPISGRGTWDGQQPFDYQGGLDPERPLVILTRARVHARRVHAFWRSVPLIRRHLDTTPGCPFHIGFGEHPLLTLATFSVWENLARMQAFAYRKTPHHRASRDSAQDSWLSESLFARFAIERVEGDLARHRRLAALLAG